PVSSNSVKRLDLARTERSAGFFLCPSICLPLNEPALSVWFWALAASQLQNMLYWLPLAGSLP
ncbi:hypothetical protein, partial [Herminiimonas sp. CN]|uniref:hypothetical protein n=1 Tax=Herminiimonas sp. CN TaxID=1349818 RepID=UPI001EE64F84